MLSVYLILIIGGCLTGFLAGLLGIGGGIIIVPILAFAFHILPETTASYMQYAAGTSLGIMIFTAISSIPHKLRQREVNFTIIKMFTPYIVFASILGAIVARFLNPKLLAIFFALTLLTMLIKMLFQKDHELITPKRNSKRKSAFWGTMVGFKSGIFGLGGGIIIIPYIHSLGYSMRIAIGTSSLFTLIIALVGSITFAITGITDHNAVSWTLGYLYLPAILLVAPTSMIFSKIGAKLSSKAPLRLLKWIFLFILAFSAVKLLLTAI